jgi:hypothetical protein
MQGFSLHAAVHCGAGDRQAIEQLCRCITRPALANERMVCNAAGQVVLKRKTPWRDGGTTNLVMSPRSLCSSRPCWRLGETPARATASR